MNHLKPRLLDLWFASVPVVWISFVIYVCFSGGMHTAKSRQEYDQRLQWMHSAEGMISISLLVAWSVVVYASIAYFWVGLTTQRDTSSSTLKSRLNSFLQKLLLVLLGPVMLPVFYFRRGFRELLFQRLANPQSLTQDSQPGWWWLNCLALGLWPIQVVFLIHFMRNDATDSKFPYLWFASVMGALLGCIAGGVQGRRFEPEANAWPLRFPKNLLRQIATLLLLTAVVSLLCDFGGRVVSGHAMFTLVNLLYIMVLLLTTLSVGFSYMIMMACLVFDFRLSRHKSTRTCVISTVESGE